tara:strand:+ start:2065 stop:2172 length:108 start_codon:yes stop_codon:yes gene_type:complete
MDKDKELLSNIVSQLESIKEIIDSLVEALRIYLRK